MRSEHITCVIACSLTLLAQYKHAQSQEQNPEKYHTISFSQKSSRIGGPDQVENLLEHDIKAKRPLLQFDSLKPYFKLKQLIKDKIGLNFALDYSTVYLGATESFNQGHAASGILRFYGSWDLVGSDQATGAFEYTVENRHAYTIMSPSSFGYNTGYAGLFESPFSGRRWTLTNLYWRQRLFNKKFFVVGGLLNTTDYINIYPLSSPWLHFMNFAFSTGSATIATSRNATLGVITNVFLNDNIYVLAGLADANADPTKPLNGFETFFKQKEYLKNVELGWTHTEKRSYFDNVHVTFWQVDKRTETYHPHGWGVAFSFTLLPGTRWMPFLRGGYSKGGSSLLQKSISTGFALKTVPKRDLLGFGFNWGEPNETTFGSGLRDQYSLEMFYRVHVSNHIAITPDLQLIVHPALSPKVGSIWVFGVRARLEL